MKTVAFVPIRLNSKRVVGKNLKLLGNEPLLSYVFKELTKVNNIDEVYAFCSSEEIIDFLPAKVKFLKRSEELDKDTTLGAEIYTSFINTIDADVYILAHTTSPFIKANSIANALNNVISNVYDSAFSAEKIQTFTWFKDKPLNYDLSLIPRTQDLEPIFIETSAFFIFQKNIWVEHNRRIGFKPYIQVVDKIEGIDIDNPEDFEFAERISSLLNSKD